MEKVPVVVTIGGLVTVGVGEELTAKELQEKVIASYNIDSTQIEEPFVVVSDNVTNQVDVCQDEDKIKEKIGEQSVLRVVLPLVPKS